jgi:hypothetical protein
MESSGSQSGVPASAPKVPGESEMEPSSSALTPDASATVRTFTSMDGSDTGQPPSKLARIDSNPGGDVSGGAVGSNDSMQDPKSSRLTTEDREWDTLLDQYFGENGFARFYPDVVEWTAAAHDLDFDLTRSALIHRMTSTRELVGVLSETVHRIPARKEVPKLLQSDEHWQYLQSPKSPEACAPLPRLNGEITPQWAGQNHGKRAGGSTHPTRGRLN